MGETMSTRAAKVPSARDTTRALALEPTTVARRARRQVVRKANAEDRASAAQKESVKNDQAAVRSSIPAQMAEGVAEPMVNLHNALAAAYCHRGELRNTMGAITKNSMIGTRPASNPVVK